MITTREEDRGGLPEEERGTRDDPVRKRTRKTERDERRTKASKQAGKRIVGYAQVLLAIRALDETERPRCRRGGFSGAGRSRGAR